MGDELSTFGSFAILTNLIPLAVAYLLALPIGWNRDKEERSAGLRTFPLVAVASCGFVQAAQSMPGFDAQAMARVIAGIITGMGFIGGGAILKLKNSVKGTATATSLWVTGAIGAGVGLGSYDVAVLLCLITVATLWAFSPFKRDTNEKAPDKNGADEE